MALPYRFPTTATYATVFADLGNVESSVGNETSLSTPDVAVADPVPAVATLLEQSYATPGLGVQITSLPQRGTVVERDFMDVLLGRPQLKPKMRAYSDTFCTHVPIPRSGLDSAALDVDLGATWRFIVDDTCLVAPPFYPSGGLGAFGWTPAQGTGDLVNIQLEFNSNLLTTTHVPVVIPGHTYQSRLGTIVRPAVNVLQWMASLKANSDYAGGSQLVTTQADEFSVSIVADIDESDWAWTDLVGTFDAALVPEKVTNCVLRLISDRLLVYGHHHRAFDEVITDVAEGPHQKLNLPARRPTIIVWSMRASGYGALAVITPKVIYSGDFTFPDGAGWPLQALSGVTGPGAYQATGGLSFGFPNFLASGTLDLDKYGSAAQWSLYDIGVWDHGLTAAQALVVATKLDSVYGVHR